MKQKRRQTLAEKKAEKLAAYRKPGKSAYARKFNRNAKGNFGPGSPFRSVVTVVEDAAA